MVSRHRAFHPRNASILLVDHPHVLQSWKLSTFRLARSGGMRKTKKIFLLPSVIMSLLHLNLVALAAPSLVSAVVVWTRGSPPGTSLAERNTLRHWAPLLALALEIPVRATCPNFLGSERNSVMRESLVHVYAVCTAFTSSAHAFVKSGATALPLPAPPARPTRYLSPIGTTNA